MKPEMLWNQCHLRFAMAVMMSTLFWVVTPRGLPARKYTKENTVSIFMAETSVPTYGSTRLHNPEQQHRLENLFRTLQVQKSVGISCLTTHNFKSQ
jgi:hypothetical protein